MPSLFGDRFSLRLERASCAAVRACISLGSNIDGEINLPLAVRELAKRCALLGVSPVYETTPVGRTDQANFLNAAVLVETELPPAALKQVLADIEERLGRVRTGDKNAPRTIDLDISLYDDRILEIGNRHIPDPDILLFPHVAVPLSDIAPYYLHQETGQTLREIADGMERGALNPRPDVDLTAILHE